MQRKEVEIDVAKIVKAVWKILIGGGMTFFGFTKLQPFLGQTQITVESLLWIAVVAVGVNVLAGAFD